MKIQKSMSIYELKWQFAFFFSKIAQFFEKSNPIIN